jgi:hypothetical protein
MQDILPLLEGLLQVMEKFFSSVNMNTSKPADGLRQ